MTYSLAMTPILTESQQYYSELAEKIYARARKNRSYLRVEKPNANGRYVRCDPFESWFTFCISCVPSDYATFIQAMSYWGA